MVAHSNIEDERWTKGIKLHPTLNAVLGYRRGILCEQINQPASVQTETHTPTA